MTNTEPRESAQIIQFPARGRFAPAEAKSALAQSFPSKIAIGSNWYHQDAIEEERSTKN